MSEDEREDQTEPTPDEATPDVAPFECAVLLAMRPNGGGTQIIPQPPGKTSRRGCSIEDARAMATSALSTMNAQSVLDAMAQAAQQEEQQRIAAKIAGGNGRNNGGGGIREIFAGRRRR